MLLLFLFVAADTAPGRRLLVIGLGKGYKITFLDALRGMALLAGSNGLMMAFLTAAGPELMLLMIKGRAGHTGLVVELYQYFLFLLAVRARWNVIRSSTSTS